MDILNSVWMFFYVEINRVPVLNHYTSLLLIIFMREHASLGYSGLSI